MMDSLTLCVVGILPISGDEKWSFTLAMVSMLS